MTSYAVLDDLVKEYILYRGFAATLKAFDNDLKIEKEKAFRAERIIDQMMSFISNYDLTSLRDLWQHLQIRIFKRLDAMQNGSALRLESGILKLYLVNCVQTKRQEKIKEFFDKMTLELQGTPDWRDWFALPFLQNPETHPTFQNHFSRQWQDTLLLSLHNFLAIVFSRLPAPRLSEFQSTSNKIKKLRDENAALKQAIFRQKQAVAAESVPTNTVRFPDVGIQPRDLMDDFCIIAQQDNVISQPNNNETQVKTLKSFLRNITGGSASTSGAPSPSHPSDRKSKRPDDRSGPESLRKSLGDAASARTNHTPLKRVAKSVPSFASDAQESSVEADASHACKLPFLLLGQEEYREHNSEIAQCKFSGSKCVIGSCDIDGVIKIWSASPGVPHTMATFISNAPVTSLDWFPHSDKHFVYGSSNGIFRICDVEERKVITELQTSNGQTGSSLSVQQLSCSPNNGHVIAVSAASAGEPRVRGSLMLYDTKSNTYLERDLCGTLEGSVTGGVPVMTSLLFNHNCQMLIAGATDGKIRIFDLRKRECISSWTVCEDGSAATRRNVLSLQLSADETKIFALTADGLFSSWSFVQTSQKLTGSLLPDPYFKEAPSYPRSYWGKQFALAADGHHFLCSSTSGGVIYAPTAGGEVEKVLGLRGHRSHATCTDWSLSNDCGPCVTAGADGVIRVSTLLSQ